MSVHLRLARHGSTNRPFYHIVAALKSRARDSRPLEKLGEYDPLAQATLRTPPPAWAPQMGALTPEARIDINALLGRMHNHRYWKIGNINRPPSPDKDPYDNEGQVVHSGIARAGDIVRQKHVEWNLERVQYWLSNGAQPTAPVAKLLIKGGILPPGRVHRGRFRSLWGDSVHDSVALGYQKDARDPDVALQHGPGGIVIRVVEPPKAPAADAAPEEVQTYQAALAKYNADQERARELTSDRKALSDEQMGYTDIPEDLLHKPGGFLTETTKHDWRPLDAEALPDSVTEELADKVAEGLRLIDATPALREWSQANKSAFHRRVRRRRESKRLARTPRLLAKPDAVLAGMRQVIAQFRSMGRMPPAALLVRHHQLRVAYAMKYHIPYWPLVGTPHMPRI